MMQSQLVQTLLQLTLVKCLLHIAGGQSTNNDDGCNPNGNALLEQNSILLDMKLQDLRLENQRAQQNFQQDLQQSFQQIIQQSQQSLQQNLQQSIQQSQQSFHRNLTDEIKRTSDIEVQKLDRIIDRLQKIEHQSGILVQQHYSGTTFFNRTWNEYKVGFGDVTGNYWIGNDRLHELTKYGQYKMRVDLKAKSNNQWYWAEYSTFRVDDESNQYMLHIGGHNGTAGDGGISGLSLNNGAKFSTVDRDNDNWGEGSCALHHIDGRGGGFWYKFCSYVYLNSPSRQGSDVGFAWAGLPIGALWGDRQLLVSRMTLHLSNELQ